MTDFGETGSSPQTWSEETKAPQCAQALQQFKAHKSEAHKVCVQETAVTALEQPAPGYPRYAAVNVSAPGYGIYQGVWLAGERGSAAACD